MLKELNFPRILQKDNIVGYGGNQEWFTKYLKRSAGCGCTSAVNIAAYYASVNPEKRNLYKENITYFNQEEYVDVMEEMFKYMKPGFMGYPYIKKLAEQFVKFCKERGVSMEASILETFNTCGDAFAFVKENIDTGHPIALLILLHRAKQLRKDIWHWLTITGYFEGSDNNSSSQIIVSNYGKREEVCADILFEVHQRNKIKMVSFRDLANHKER